MKRALLIILALCFLPVVCLGQPTPTPPYPLAWDYFMAEGASTQGTVVDTNSLAFAAQTTIEAQNPAYGFIVNYYFQAVPTTHTQWINFTGMYDGTVSHYANAFAWDYNATDWVRLTRAAKDVPHGTSAAFYRFTAYSSDMVSSNNLIFRLDHIGTGVAGHELVIDYLYLESIPTPSPVPTVSPVPSPTPTAVPDLVISVSSGIYDGYQNTCSAGATVTIDSTDVYSYNHDNCVLDSAWKTCAFQFINVTIPNGHEVESASFVFYAGSPLASLRNADISILFEDTASSELLSVESIAGRGWVGDREMVDREVDLGWNEFTGIGYIIQNVINRYDWESGDTLCLSINPWITDSGGEQLNIQAYESGNIPKLYINLAPTPEPTSSPAPTTSPSATPTPTAVGYKTPPPTPTPIPSPSATPSTTPTAGPSPSITPKDWTWTVFTVAANNDDAFETGAGVMYSADASDYIHVYANPAEWNTDTYTIAGVRFQSINLAQGKKIQDAYLSLQHSFNHEGALFRVFGNDTNDAANFSTGSISTRLKTTAFTKFSDQRVYSGGWSNYTNLAAPVQEIINRPVWASGNDLVLILEASTDGISDFEFTSYEYGSHDHGASLHIATQAVTPPPPTPSPSITPTPTPVADYGWRDLAGRDYACYIEQSGQSATYVGMGTTTYQYVGSVLSEVDGWYSGTSVRVKWAKTGYATITGDWVWHGTSTTLFDLGTPTPTPTAIPPSLTTPSPSPTPTPSITPTPSVTPTVIPTTTPAGSRLILRPNSIGTTTQWIPEGSIVNHNNVSYPIPSDAIYNWTGTTTYIDLYGMSNFNSVSSISHMTIRGNMRNSFMESTASSASVRLGYRLNGINYWGNTCSLTQSYVMYSSRWNVNSETGVAWTNESLNAIQIGVSYDSGDGKPEINQEYIELWFSD